MASFQGYSLDPLPAEFDTMMLEDLIQDQNLMKTWVYYLYVAVILVFFTSSRLYRHTYILNRSFRKDVRWFSWPTRYLRRLLIRSPPRFIPYPTYGHLVIILGFVALNLYLAIHSSSPDYQILQLARRTGWLVRSPHSTSPIR